ncbi:MAG: 50S ribosomal protein L6 [Candidatus Curtissbacteria bacterium GW2011_GWA1_40_9]|uniref:Large ribosomal subunit protein uL6 n=1 Tax=Candidatus Curtissbacteria bacterium GW2011_GWA1_40_9 TaxID=1618408 RepID=A0A0G0W116_9BACT|nr:MAG: 50S ribosomal protein L6 [Candidatus Curtissbacteria bacterium GW2011_GWA1_40_9]
MSKIGKMPISLPTGVTATVTSGEIEISGPKGKLKFQFRPEIKVVVNGSEIKVDRISETKFAKSLHGLTRSVIANMVKGVLDGHEKVLELVGVGYKVAKQGENLVLNVGYSHPVVINHIPGINLDAKENKIIVTGADKILVGETAARIRRVRPPEPYKGKGIKYVGEYIRRKAGKALKAGV